MLPPRSVSPSRKSRRPLWVWRGLPLPFYRRLISYAIGCFLLIGGSLIFLPPHIPLWSIVHQTFGSIHQWIYEGSLKVESLAHILMQGFVSQEEIKILKQKIKSLEIIILSQNYELQALRSTYSLIPPSDHRASILRKLDNTWIIKGTHLALGQPVLYKGALAGHVVEVQGETGWVHLLSHPNTLIHALNQRTQTEALIQGNGSYESLAILRVQPGDPWNPGDWIFTRGGLHEPPGLPIGQVGATGDTILPFALSPEARFVEILETSPQPQKGGKVV